MPHHSTPLVLTRILREGHYDALHHVMLHLFAPPATSVLDTCACFVELANDTRRPFGEYEQDVYKALCEGLAAQTGTPPHCSPTNDDWVEEFRRRCRALPLLQSPSSTTARHSTAPPPHPARPNHHTTTTTTAHEPSSSHATPRALEW